MNQFCVGAGKADILYTEAMLPTFGENYTGIHDLPMVQALMLRGEESFAIVSVDTVILFERDEMLSAAAEELGLAREHILLHATHVLSTPHFHHWLSAKDWRDDPPHRGAEVSDGEATLYMARDNLIAKAHLDAVRQACRTARQTLQPARFGYGEAETAVSVNRVVETADGWWQGVNQDGPVDRCVGVLRFESLDGKLLAIAYNPNVAPGCLEGSTFDGQRLISGDLASASERFVDRAYGEGVVSLYLTGFSGDQWQALRARKDYLTREGRQVIEDLGSGGFALVDVLATRLGEQVVKASDGIDKLQPVQPHLDRFGFVYTGQRCSTGFADGPTRECRFEETEPLEAEIAILQLGDTAIVACGVELCYETAQKIKRDSPFTHTLIMEFTTPGGGYLPESVFYDRMSFQARKSRFARGTAERFGEDVLSSLREVKKKTGES